MTQLFAWVHISDTHFGHGGASSGWDQALVLETLREDVRIQCERLEVRLDAVIFSGDVAYSGGDLLRGIAQPEYEIADIWLQNLANDNGIARSSVFIVPGNHDIQRSTDKESSVARLVRALRNDEESIDDALQNSRDRDSLHARLRNFWQFAARYPSWEPRDPDAFWTARTVETRENLKISLFGLNTALLASDRDQGKLRVGKAQLAAMQKAFNGVSPAINIAVGHHPLHSGWLFDEKEVAGYIRSTAQLYLSGHTHEHRSIGTSHGDNSSIIHIGAGASHAGMAEQNSHGYNIAIIVRNNEHYEARIWPRRWSRQTPRFVVDAENVPEGTTFATHVLLPADRLAADKPRSDQFDVRINNPTVVVTRTADYETRCDSPPTSVAWVGRELEIEIARTQGVRVLAITGIGGQGKSALAARCTQDFAKWDWRDCREEADTLQTQILKMVERITLGEITARELAGAESAALVDALLSAMAQEPWLLIFDNVDHYVDVQKNMPTGLLSLVVSAALARQHRSRVIITCRPRIVYTHSAFSEISLSGLTLEQTRELFVKRGTVAQDDSTANNIATAHAATQGHPLWLNLIATQVARNPAIFKGLISEIEKGRSSGLPLTMLRSIWATLTEKQQHVLRCMAEAVRPESEDRLSEYVDLSYNQFSKNLRVLRTLDLIVVKSAPLAPDLLELHPLIRAFLRTNFAKHERLKYIDRIARFFEGIMRSIAPQLSQGVSFAVLEHWMQRAELAINALDYSKAISVLHEISDRLLAAGYAEEYVRVSLRLASELDWIKAAVSDYPHFDDFFQTLVRTLSYMDRHDDCDVLLERYEMTITGRSARYAALCESKSHALWVRGDFENAKEWARRGVEMTSEGKLDTRFTSVHELALAQRDSGEVETALSSFLGGELLVDVLSKPPLEGKPGAFYGNIGRCLWLLGRFQDALVAYKKSALLLEDEAQATTRMNQGWARFWIAEALRENGQYELAYVFFRDAAEMWKRLSPSCAARGLAAAEILAREHQPGARAMSATECREAARCWIQK